MFIRPKYANDDSPPDWAYRVKIAVVMGIGSIVAAIVLFTVQGLVPTQTVCPAPSTGVIAILTIITIFECIYFGGGVAFMVFVGPMITKVLPKYRAKMWGIYICIGWFFLSWVPHISLHHYLSGLAAAIALEICFHWPTCAATIFVTTFIYKILKAAALKPGSNNTGNKFVRFLKSEIFQWVILTAPFAIFVFLMGSIPGAPLSLPPPPPGTPDGELFPRVFPLLIIISIVEAILFGFAMAFLIKGSIILARIPQKKLKIRAIPLVLAIWWILASYWWHSKTHQKVIYYSPECDAFYNQRGVGYTTGGTIIGIEIGFHWTVMVCSLIISYNLYGLILMAYDYSTSPFRQSGKTASATEGQSGKENTTAVSGKSGAETNATEARENDDNLEMAEKEDA